MTPEILETQLANLRQAVAWLQLRNTAVPFVRLGRYPQPLIEIRPGRGTSALKNSPKFEATTIGRLHTEGGEQVCWQATLFHCRVEWSEPAFQGAQTLHGGA